MKKISRKMDPAIEDAVVYYVESNFKEPKSFVEITPENAKYIAKYNKRKRAIRITIPRVHVNEFCMTHGIEYEDLNSIEKTIQKKYNIKNFDSCWIVENIGRMTFEAWKMWMQEPFFDDDMNIQYIEL